eukprot:351934-Chlamydomonas_euryale.AAC.3
MSARVPGGMTATARSAAAGSGPRSSLGVDTLTASRLARICSGQPAQSRGEFGLGAAERMEKHRGSPQHDS